MSRLVDVLEERGCLRGKQDYSDADIDAAIANMESRIDALSREMRGWSRPLSVTERKTEAQYNVSIRTMEARIKEIRGWKKKK
jgi:hypothetical protein